MREQVTSIKVSLNQKSGSEPRLRIAGSNAGFTTPWYYCQSVKVNKNKPTSTLPPWKVKEHWKLVLKTNGDKTFGFSSSYWTNDNTLNPTADEKAAGNAKYPAFTKVPFSKELVLKREIALAKSPEFPSQVQLHRTLPEGRNQLYPWDLGMRLQKLFPDGRHNT